MANPEYGNGFLAWEGLACLSGLELALAGIFFTEDLAGSNDVAEGTRPYGLR